MKTGALITLALMLASPCQADGQHGSDLGIDVRTASGVVRGVARDERGVVAFKGVPYARPPVGPLRWHAPEPVVPSTAVIDATRFGMRCWSALAVDRTPGPLHGEDWLSLNIWSGARSAAERRPVMVWLHGGGFEFGSSAEPSTDGSRLAAKGVIVVSLNYRLGVLGFLAHPELDREGPSGDYGLQDQIAALRWVRANIAAFGGDPDNVTVFGESAGAHAVGLLLASPLAKGLIDKAIGSSGAFWDSEHGSLSTFAESRKRGVEFMRRLGTASIADLRGVPAERLNAAAPWSFADDPGTTAFSPSVDRYVVPEAPGARYARGRQLRVPLLAGWNADEQWPFRARALPHATAVEFRGAAESMFGKDRLAEFLKLYPANSDAQARQSAETLAGDLVIAEQTWQWLELHARTTHAPVWGYTFTYTSPYVPVASHAVDPPFVFGTLTPQRVAGSDVAAMDADRALSEQMMSYWVNFAMRGDPNGPGLPAWPRYVPSGPVLVFGQKVEAATNDRAARFRFLGNFRRGGLLPDSWRGVRAVPHATAVH